MTLMVMKLLKRRILMKWKLMRRRMWRLKTALKHKREAHAIENRPKLLKPSPVPEAAGRVAEGLLWKKKKMALRLRKRQVGKRKRRRKRKLLQSPEVMKNSVLEVLFPQKRKRSKKFTKEQQQVATGKGSRTPTLTP